MNALKTLGVLACFFLAACGGKPRFDYEQNDLELITAYTAKEACSCLFVMEQPEDFCLRWTKQNPPLAKLTVDREHKRVQASALMLWGATAEWVSDREGCAFK